MLIKLLIIPQISLQTSIFILIVYIFVFLQRLHINIILRGIEKMFLFPLLSIVNLF